MSLPVRIVVALAIPLLLATPTAQAGRIVIRTAAAPPGVEDIIEFNARGDLRLGGGTMPDSMGMIARDGRFYFFGEIDGKPVVVDIEAAEKKARAKGLQKEAGSPPPETVKDLHAAGRRQTVAGVEGEVFVASWMAGDASREEEVVLTRDPRLAPLLKSLGALPELGQKTTEKQFADAVIARGYFPLKSERAEVTALDFAEVPAERFELKARPGDDMELVFQMIFGAALGQLGQALEAATQAIGEGLGAALESADETPADEAPAGPSPLSAASLEAQQRIEAQLQRVARPRGLQLPRDPPDYAGWTPQDGGPLQLHLPPMEGYNLSSGGTSIRVEFTPESSGTSVYLDMALIEAGIKPGVALEEARKAYRRMSQRLRKGEILGHQPMVLDGIAGALEIYDETDPDSGDRRRVVKWLGFRQDEAELSPIECLVAVDAAAYERLAPTIGGILQSLRVMPAATE